jgi:ferredoxin
VQVWVDAERCQGHGRCAGLCPEVFDLDDEGYARVGLRVIPPELQRDVEAAVNNCPEGAISVDVATQGVTS